MTPTDNISSANTKLYTLQTDFIQNQGKFGAPRLLPKTQAGGNGSSTQKGQIDIVNNFPWTTLPPNTRSNVPYMQLVEYRITSSTIIQSVIQQARSTVDSINNFPDNVKAAVKQGLNIADFQITDEDINKYLQSTIGITGSSKTWLDPYKHLYPVEETGWIYNFPYFEDLNQSVTNKWSEKAGGDTGRDIDNIMSTSVGKIVNAAERISSIIKLGNISQPGSYTETIKSFSPEQASVYSVKFTLFNTLNFDDIQKNWEFCFLLTYQNLPNRRTISLLDPPVIYGMTIPGVHQSLYAYISKLTIDNVGAKRYIDLPIGRKLIPEAYNISIEITDLLTNTQNLQLYAHTNDRINATIKK